MPSAFKGARPATPKTNSSDIKTRAPLAKAVKPKAIAQINDNRDENEKQKIVVPENSYAADWEEVTELMEEVCNDD